MSSDIDIRKQFQEKFKDFKAEVPTDGWSRLEEALNASATPVVRRRLGWRQGVAAAAAVALLIVGSLLFMQRPAELPDPMVSDLVTAPITTPPQPSATQPLSKGLSQPDQLVVQAIKPVSQPRGKQGIKEAEALVVAEAFTDKEIDVDSPVLPNIDTPIQKEEEQVIVSSHPEGIVGYAFEEKREPILLAFSGRGGLSSYQQTVNTPMTLRTASAAESLTEEAKKNLFAAKSNVDNVSEMEHDQPVSFGITVSKAIVDDLYIETGLVYSYLHSKVRNANSNFEVQETQRFHYLGVPLNVNYNVLSLNKLNVYASIGGMIEKDIYGRLRDEKESVSVDVTNQSGELREQPISQRNPQISVNAGVGLSYPLFDNLRLYGKIGGAYYFDAENEHKTIYSDRKIVMDLSLGIRYEFK